MPSIATSTSGRTVIGFSAAGTSEYVNAGVAERFSSDAAGTLRAPQLFTPPTAAYNPPGDAGLAGRGRRWGGVSATVVDGCDGSTIWTLQQFTDAVELLRAGGGPDRRPRRADAGQRDAVGHRRAAWRRSTCRSRRRRAAARHSSTPGAGYLCRIGALIPGVTVNSVTRTGPTTVTINVSTVNATPGLKTITRHQSRTRRARRAAPILRVTPGPFVVIDSPVAGSVGQPLTVRGWAVDGTAPTGTGVDAVHVYATPAGGAPVFLGAATYGQSRPDVGAAHGSRFTPSGSR